MRKTERFISIFEKAERKYGCSDKRLSAEGWNYDWQVLVATIMSAQSRDEVTILAAEKLFEKYTSLESLANAEMFEVLKIFSGLNYNKTKAKNVIQTAKMLVCDFDGIVPSNIEDLVLLPGVGRKTANLVLTTIYGMDGICVDTHVHRISNVFGFVKTKNPTQTERALLKFVPRKYWAKINRIFVLWGKDCSGRDKKKLLRAI